MSAATLALVGLDDLRLLEVHEGWVHLGTTLNGQSQPVCTFLSKGPPSSTLTQEGLAVLTEVFAFASCRFQRPYRGRSNGYDPLRLVDLVCGLWRNGEVLGMHAMLRDVLRSHRQKCPRAYVQSHECVRNFTQNL